MESKVQSKFFPRLTVPREVQRISESWRIYKGKPIILTGAGGIYLFLFEKIHNLLLDSINEAILRRLDLCGAGEGAVFFQKFDFRSYVHTMLTIHLHSFLSMLQTQSLARGSTCLAPIAWKESGLARFFEILINFLK